MEIRKPLKVLGTLEGALNDVCENVNLLEDLQDTEKLKVVTNLAKAAETLEECYAKVENDNFRYEVDIKKEENEATRLANETKKLDIEERKLALDERKQNHEELRLMVEEALRKKEMENQLILEKRRGLREVFLNVLGWVFRGAMFGATAYMTIDAFHIERVENGRPDPKAMDIFRDLKNFYK